MVYHALSCPQGGLVLIRHNDYAKDWGAMGYQGLTTSAISYKPHINSSMVQGERTRTGAQKTEGEAQNGMETGAQDIAS